MTTIDLTQTMTQTAFGTLVGVSRQAVGDMVARGVIDLSEPVGQCMVKYCAHLREVSAGRQGSDDLGLDLVAERARLASEQADKIAMQNAVTRRELAPVHAIEDVLTRAGAKVAGILEAIPGKVKRRVPSLKATELDLIQNEIAKARNIAAAISLQDLGDDIFSVEAQAVAQEE